MKKLFLLLSAVGLIFTACEDSDSIEEGNGASPFIPKITISPKNLIFSCHGGTQKVSISANFQYEVNENASWLTVEQTGDGLQVVAEISQTQTERSAYILITNSKYNISETIEVLQESNIPKIKLAEQNIEVDFEPAQYSVGVSSPYSWDATSKNDWIVIDTTTGIAGNEELKFTTKRNEEEQERKGTIVLKNSDYNLVAELYITQVKFAPEISIDTESLNFTCDGGTQEIAISANFEYEWTEDANWLSVMKIEKGLAITVEALDIATTRSACITISNEQYGVSRVVSVSQDAATMESGRVIYYTSSDGKVVTPFGFLSAKIVSNTYKNGQGVIILNGVVTFIGDNAFRDCSSLTSITIPDSVTFIGDNAFRDCSSLTSITIPDSVTSIGYAAFRNCTSLRSVTIPDSVTSMGNYAFRDCSSLTNVQISDLSAWCRIDFGDRYANPLLYAHNLYLNSEIFTELAIPSDITEIKSHTFVGCFSLTSVNIPNNVTRIGGYAFYCCSSLTSVTIPDSVTSIGGYAFYCCSSLTSVTIPDSVTSIGEYAFRGCTSATSVTIGNDVTSIGESAFEGCTSLTSVNIPNNVTTIGRYAFYRCSSLTSVTIGNGVTSIGEYAFYECTSLTRVNSTDLAAWCKIDFGEWVANPLYYAQNLYINGTLVKNLLIPDGVTSIGNNAFRNYTSLTSVTIPDSVTSIGKSAFDGCTSVTSVTIGNSVTSIGDYAFCSCTSLTSLTIPENATSIGDLAFCLCTGELIIKSKIVETDYSSSDYPSYKGWLSGAQFTKLTIGNNIIKIGSQVFRECSSLTSITIPDSIISMGYGAFYGCTGELTINCNITSGAFAGSNFTKVTIGNGVTSIGNGAFYYCNSLTCVYCKPTTPPSGGTQMFDFNISRGKIYVPINSVNAYKSASYWSDYSSDIIGYDFQ